MRNLAKKPPQILIERLKLLNTASVVSSVRHIRLPNIQQDLTLNQLTDLPTRIQQAKQYLKDNPDERPSTVTRIYNVKVTTLYSQLSRQPTGTCGGQNKILQEHHIRAIHDFIRSLLAYGIQPTHGLIFNSICNLKRAQDPVNFKAPSSRWFSAWWKKSGLHKIKSKLIAAIRLTAQQE